MRVIRPTPLTSALSSTTVAEPYTGEVLWNAGTTYAAGVEVIRTTTHRRYLSVGESNNINHDPALDATSTWWVDIGPTNRWAMFDQSVGTATAQSGSIEVVLAPGAIDSLALLDVVCDSIRVQMTTGGTPVYDHTVSMVSAETITNWYSYFFDPIEGKTLAIFRNLPVYANCIVTVTITSANIAQVGTCIAGMMFQIGETQHGAKASITSYSSKQRDEFGVVSVLKRTSSKKITVQVLCEAGATDAIARHLTRLDAEPVLWIGSLRKEALVVYGFYKDWEVDVAYEHVAYCSLQIEGLV